MKYSKSITFNNIPITFKITNIVVVKIPYFLEDVNLPGTLHTNKYKALMMTMAAKSKRIPKKEIKQNSDYPTVGIFDKLKL